MATFMAPRAVGLSHAAGARSVKKIFPDMVYIYILPPSIDELRRRLIKRGKDSAAIIERRLSEAREDLKHVHKADYVIINEDFGVALDDLSAVTRACQLTASRQIALNAKLLK
jgi:guanylate kinase